MYVKVLENYISFIVIKSISANKKAILLVVIMPRIIIIRSWFYKNITNYKVITVSLTNYINKGICIV